MSLPRPNSQFLLMLSVEGRSLMLIFDSPDDMKFRSSTRLFSLSACEAAIFRRALDKYCQGAPDALTIGLLDAK
jgi:uncharacterized protein (DUF1810 family)